VFGKVDDYQTTLLSLASVSSLPVASVEVKKENEDVNLDEDDEKMAEEEPNVQSDDNASLPMVVFEGPDEPITVTQRLSKDAKAALCSRDFTSNLENKLMDDMISTQHVKFNRNAPRGVLQIASSLISGIVRIQTLHAIKVSKQ